jgi:hypothetical protein
MAGWPISFSPNAKPGVKWKQENVATKSDKKKRLCERMRLPLLMRMRLPLLMRMRLSEVIENEQKEQTEPVNVVEQTDEEDSESERESEMSSSECE